MRSFAWLHKHSVQRKLIIIVLGTCCLSLLVAGVALFTYLTFAQRQAFAEDIEALSEVIAANCAGPVTFDDHVTAKELLASLRANERIAGAVILRDNGKALAATGSTNLLLNPSLPVAGGEWHGDNHLVECSPITLNGDRIGTLRVDSDFGPTYARWLRAYWLVFALTFTVVVGVGIVVAIRARRIIADPIRSLADSVREMSTDENYSLRAQTKSGGEVEQIADAFNLMAERAQGNAELAREVGERRRIEGALRESEERFRSLFQNAPVGLYRSGPDSHFLMANNAMLMLLGYTSFEELEKVSIAKDVCIDLDYRNHFSECLEKFGYVEETEVQWRRRDGRVIFVRESARAIRDASGKALYCEGCVEDITARKEAAAELSRLNRELVDTSRAAGMAEIATGVLHNVGNVLNSVSVSAQLLHDEVGRSKFASLRQAVELLERNSPNVGQYLVHDPKGRLLPAFLVKVTEHITGEQQRWLAELQQMQTYIEHMKEVVAVQQDYAKVSSVLEHFSPIELVNDALRMSHAELTRHHVTVQREFAPVPHIVADKHKVLQILINLIRNAKFAMGDCPSEERRLTLKIYKNGTGCVKIQVHDNGTGIAPENLTRIFHHGFTTRADGHGFGLHSGALAAQQLGGTLIAESDGPGKGATFTLELPRTRGNN